ncbi:MAG: ABC transporter permease, partial [Bradyrhizobium sp.]|nr:ABC transporter permease [Bradyrhizobium sp.]
MIALAQLKKLDRAIVPLLVLAGWEAFSRSGALPAALLPAPSTVVWAWADWLVGTDGNTQTYSGHWVADMLA